jgi:hypothetical protein
MTAEVHVFDGKIAADGERSCGEVEQRAVIA